MILLTEAQALFRRGILHGMFGDFPDDGIPKYVWVVDGEREAYEAKIVPGTFNFKGYCLEEEDPMRGVVLSEWAKRWLAN